MDLSLDKIRQRLNSPEGRNAMHFLLFLVISAVLWVVMALNEEAQRDLRCVVSLSNVPDSVVQITPLPPYVGVSVKAKGTSLLKYIFSDDLNMKINYRNYISGNRFLLNDVALKAFFRSRFGQDVQILSVNPDSISLYFTSLPGVKVPVNVDAHVEPGPKFAIIGKVRSLTDSVTLYSVDGMAHRVKSLSTAPIVLNDLRSSQVLTVPVLTPAHTRAVPDSVDVSIDVEPLVAKTRLVDITPVNVPLGARVITDPGQVEVYYMVPMSTYKKADSNPRFKVVADYRTNTPGSDKIAISLSQVPDDFMNVFLEVDSVTFILEQ